MPDSEPRAFVIGVANGRGMTSGLFQAYAGAAQQMASTSVEGDAIATCYETICATMSPMLEIDVVSLLDGMRAACKRPEFRDEFVVDALASVHVDAAKAIRESREQSGDRATEAAGRTNRRSTHRPLDGSRQNPRRDRAGIDRLSKGMAHRVPPVTLPLRPGGSRPRVGGVG